MSFLKLREAYLSSLMSYTVYAIFKTNNHSGIHTYLHKAGASVSNGDMPHGTTAHICYTAASLGTNYTEKERG